MGREELGALGAEPAVLPGTVAAAAPGPELSLIKAFLCKNFLMTTETYGTQKS